MEHFFNGTFKIYIYNFIYFWLCWVFLFVQAVSSCREWGAALIVVLKLLIAVASLAVRHSLYGERASVVVVPAQ